MNKYERLKNELEERGIGKMKCFGNSMTPILYSGGLVTFKKEKEYDTGDMVFCRVKGRYIDCHIITHKNDDRGYMIANNHGFQNGWTKTVYGKAIHVEYKNESKTL